MLCETDGACAVRTCEKKPVSAYQTSTAMWKYVECEIANASYKICDNVPSGLRHGMLSCAVKNIIARYG